MNLRKSILLIVSLGMIAALVACSSSSSNSNTPSAVTPQSSSQTQSVQVGTAFAPLSVTVTNSSGAGISGVSVTFTVTAGSTGATGSFATGGTTDTETTNSSGVAQTSQTLTAGTVAGAFTVTATAGSASGNFSLTNTAGAAAQLVATGGNNQTPAPGANLNALSATVEDQYGNVLTSSTASVQFAVTAGGTGASATFSPGPTDTETASNGVATTSQTLTANSTVGAFTVTASSSGLTSATFTETITTPPTIAAGNYVYHLAGLDSDDNSDYFVSGVITITNGINGSVISGGEQDYIDYYNIDEDQINPTGSTIAATADGNVQFILVTCSATNCSSTDTAVGVAGTETINAAFTPNNANKAYITEFDTSGAASGEFIAQNSTDATATPSAGYAFVLSGFDGIDSPSGGDFPLAMGGVINIDGTPSSSGNTMDGNGSIFDANDSGSPNDGSTGLEGIFPGETFGTGTVTAPDSFGRVVFALNPTDTTNFPGPINVVGYIIDNRISLVETTDSYGGQLGGIAYSQGANTGTFSTSSSSISGVTYVAGLNGSDTSSDTLQVAGELALASSGGAVSGYVDFNDLSGTEEGIAVPDPFSATAYTVDSAGAGDVTISGLTDGNGDTFNLQLYVDGNGNALAITLDTTDVIAGRAIAQTTVDTDANFTGNYAIGAYGWDGGENGPYSLAGTLTATGTGDQITPGVADIDWYDFATPAVNTYQGEPFTGTYQAFGSFGILSPGTITGLDLDTGFTNVDNFDFYLVDSQGDGVVIETDTNQTTLGIISQQ
jgi:hypothetical protein